MDLMTILVAIIPPLYLFYYIYQMDKVEKEPLGLLIKLFFFGVLSVIPIVILELIFSNLLAIKMAHLATDFLGYNSYQIIQNFLIIALVEEGFKFLFLKWGSWKDKNFNCHFDALVYACVVSLGFATLENLLYVYSYGFENALLRAFTAIPGHFCFGVFMGYYYSDAKYYYLNQRKGNYRLYLLLSVIVPTLLHGFYDYVLTLEYSWVFILFLIYIIMMDYLALKHIKRMSQEDRYLDLRATSSLKINEGEEINYE